jgi:transglutaminase-like putative cysteine protease
MRYRITHTTLYTYEAPVSQCLNEVRLTPRSLPNQTVYDCAFDVQPQPVSFGNRKDFFGNEVTTFSVFERHEKLTATATSIVEVSPIEAPSSPTIRWEQARDVIAKTADDQLLDPFQFLFDSPFVATSRELAEYARPSFPAGRPLVEAITDFSHRIHDEFKYEPKSTSIEMPLIDVLEERRGVCQDFAHVMIGGLRSLRLAARYVSGYIRSGGRVQGAQASHAWVSAYVPNSGWWSFDPTNDVMPSEGHITVAWGRDYGDVTPVKGVTLGGGGQVVDVSVFVKPEVQP